MAQKKIPLFKNEADFENDLKRFANTHRVTIAEHSKRISDYFEMSCYTMIIRYYELQGFTFECANLQTDKFRFKCSPAGLLENFSFFKVKKEDKIYRIYHNASVQSKYDSTLYTTPDIVVAKDEEPKETENYYNTKKRFSYIPNKQMVTFCEAKHYVPFPELIFNFIGTVHELLPSCLKKRHSTEDIFNPHIAPSLMMSGSYSKQAKQIKKSLEKRYMLNIIGDLFVDPYKSVFCKTGIRYITTLGKKGWDKNQ